MGNSIDYVKEAKKKPRDAKKRSEVNRKEEERLEKISGRKERKITLGCEHDLFLAKLKRKFTTLDWDRINDYNESSLGINVFETSLDEWYSVHGKLKGLFGVAYDNFEETFPEIVERISEKGKLR